MADRRSRLAAHATWLAAAHRTRSELPLLPQPRIRRDDGAVAWATDQRLARRSFWCATDDAALLEPAAQRPRLGQRDGGAISAGEQTAHRHRQFRRRRE